MFYTVTASARNIETEEKYRLTISSLDNNNEDFYEQADKIIHEIKEMNEDGISKLVQEASKNFPKYRLCYIDGNIACFTDDFDHVHGDDFNDAPYEHNAGYPYEYNNDWTPEENREHGHTHIRYLAFEPCFWVYRPCDRAGYNSPYSVNDINNGAIAWLYCEEAGGLMAGTTIEEAIIWFKKAKVRFGELKL